MEYMAPPISTLKDVIREKGVEDDTVKALCRTVGGVLQKMHSIHIIHGDLTSSNLMVDGEEIIMIDFGTKNSSVAIFRN